MNRCSANSFAKWSVLAPSPGGKVNTSNSLNFDL